MYGYMHCDDVVLAQQRKRLCSWLHLLQEVIDMCLDIEANVLQT